MSPAWVSLQSNWSHSCIWAINADGIPSTGYRDLVAGELTDPDLRTAVAGRDHWRVVDETTAAYEPPDVTATVRVGRIARPPITGPTRHDRYYGVVLRDGRAMHRTSTGFAAEVVRWAERQRLE